MSVRHALTLRNSTMQVSQAITTDFPDLQLSSGLEVIAGLLYIPLSVGGGDFIAFLRKGQPRQVHWAGRPFKTGEVRTSLEPRKSFKLWSETVAGRCRAWTDEHLETAGVLALVYGKVKLSLRLSRSLRLIAFPTVHRSVAAKGVCATNDKVDEYSPV